MADFARFVSGCEKEIGADPGEFLKAYNANRQELSDLSLEFSPLAHALLALVDSRNSWQGSVKDLLISLTAKSDELDRHDPRWPKNAKALASELSRIEVNLHAIGYTVKWLGKDRLTRRRIVRVGKKSKPSTVEFATGEAKSAD